jgi:hypothetical protein
MPKKADGRGSYAGVNLDPRVILYAILAVASTVLLFELLEIGRGIFCREFGIACLASPVGRP